MPSLNYTAVDPLVLSPAGIQTNAFVPTAGEEYKRGDLLSVSADGVLSHADPAGSQTDWTVVCLDNCTTEQADKHSADKMGIPVYTHATLNLDAVTIKGELLTDTQKTAARAHSVNGTPINLRKPYKGEEA